MQKTGSQKFLKWMKILLLLYVVIGVVLYFIQNKLLFHPKTLPFNHQFEFKQPFKEINLPITEEENLSIVQFPVDDSICKGAVLYFHGNRRNVERYADYAVNFTKNHYAVWMIDYPGFGKSTGELSEKALYKDAAILYDMARRRFSKDRIIIYGKSLGTGIAAELASVKDCRRLILETPYYSIDKLFGHYAFLYPANLMTNYHLPTFEYLKTVDAPVTIFHGTSDEVIPFSHSKRLKAEGKKSVELVSIEKGTHNDLNDFRIYHQKLDSLLK